MKLITHRPRVCLNPKLASLLPKLNLTPLIILPCPTPPCPHIHPLILTSHFPTLPSPPCPRPPPFPQPGGSIESAQLAAVGSWSMDVMLLKLPDLSVVTTQPMGSEQVIPRSVLLAGFEGSHYHLLVGLGDGALHSWRMDPQTGALSGEGGVRWGRSLWMWLSMAIVF